MAVSSASETGLIAPIADALLSKSYLEIWRGNPLATLTAAEALEIVAREHGMMQHVNEAELHSGWARGRTHDSESGAAEVRRVLTAFVEQGVRVNLALYTGLLAELEAETLGAESALARIDEALRLSNEVGHGCSLPFLHRLRGHILLKRQPADAAQAEEAFRTSIAIAKEQSARSPVLLASLALAKLYQATGRPAEAHAVLAPALDAMLSLLPFGRKPVPSEAREAGDEGFAGRDEGLVPSPPAPLPRERGEALAAEMPEIAEAEALLAALEAGEPVAAELRR